MNHACNCNSHARKHAHAHKGELYCYKIKFNVMDIIKGIGNFLSWMMRPIELVQNIFTTSVSDCAIVMFDGPYLPD
jgi:hypothetical protein